MRYLILAIAVLSLIAPLVMFVMVMLSINMIELYDRLLGQQRLARHTIG